MFAAAGAASPSISKTHDDLLARVAAERDALRAQVDALERAKVTMKEDHNYMKRERDVLADKVMELSATVKTAEDGPSRLCATIVGSDTVFDALLDEPDVATLTNGVLSAIVSFPPARDALVAKLAERIRSAMSVKKQTVITWKKLFRKMLLYCFNRTMTVSPATIETATAIVRPVFQAVYDAEPSLLQFHFIRELLAFAQALPRFANLLSDQKALGSVTSWWDTYLRFARPDGVRASLFDAPVSWLRGLRDPPLRESLWTPNVTILYGHTCLIGKKVKFLLPSSTPTPTHTVESYDSSTGQHMISTAGAGTQSYDLLFSYVSRC